MTLASEVSDLLIEFRRRRDSEDVDDEESRDLWTKTRNEITNLFLQEDWKLSDRTIRKEVQESLNSFDRPSEDEELEPYFEDIIENLQTQSTYTAYIYFPELVEMPVGKEIGRLEIIEEPEDMDNLMNRMNRAFEEPEHLTKLYEGRTWGRFEFNSYKHRAYIVEELYSEIQGVLAALKVSIGKTSTPEELAGAISNGEGYIWHLDPEHEPSGWTKYDERIAEPTLSELSDILKKSENDRTPLEENILGSIQLLTLHSQNYRTEHSFLSLVAALEGLLLTKYERPKAGKMAEKTVQLLYPEQEDVGGEIPDYDVSDKVEDYNRVKGWYQTRSEIIHGGYRNITREEVRDLERTVEQVAKKMVRYTDEYHGLQKMGGENNPYMGLNEMFLEKRLRTNISESDRVDSGDDGRSE